MAAFVPALIVFVSLAQAATVDDPPGGDPPPAPSPPASVPPAAALPAPAPPAAAPAFRCPTPTIRGDGAFDWPDDGATPPEAWRWEWPLNPPYGAGYFDAQPFGENHHLGADLNAVDRDDFGDPVHVVADGCVTFARDIWRGWGNIVRVVHRLPGGALVETLYAHLDRVDVVPGQAVRRGEVLGTVGDAHHVYGPHLHLELRTRVGLPVGGGYGYAPGYADPIAFLVAPRGPLPREW